MPTINLRERHTTRIILTFHCPHRAILHDPKFRLPRTNPSPARYRMDELPLLLAGSRFRLVGGGGSWRHKGNEKTFRNRFIFSVNDAAPVREDIVEKFRLACIGKSWRTQHELTRTGDEWAFRASCVWPTVPPEEAEALSLII